MGEHTPRLTGVVMKVQLTHVKLLVPWLAPGTGHQLKLGGSVSVCCCMCGGYFPQKGQPAR